VPLSHPCTVTVNGAARVTTCAVCIPLSGRRTVDEIRPHVADVRTSSCDMEYTDAPSEWTGAGRCSEAPSCRGRTDRRSSTSLWSPLCSASGPRCARRCVGSRTAL
jgi:hypothetical protein